MPFTVTNEGMSQLVQTSFTSATDLRALVFKTTTPSVATIRDLATVADLLAVTTESTAVGYSRAVLAGLAVTKNNTTDQVTITANSYQWTTVAAGETWLGIAYFIHTGANDAARTLIGVDVPASSIATNGGAITISSLLITITGS
jgi:hypothetical protein